MIKIFFSNQISSGSPQFLISVLGLEVKYNFMQGQIILLKTSGFFLDLQMSKIISKHWTTSLALSPVMQIAVFMLYSIFFNLFLFFNNR